MMAGTIILPLVLFVYASWLDYSNAYATARERIERSLDVMQEHAQRVFEPVNLIFLEVEHLLVGLSRDQIRGREPRLNGQLKSIADALAQVEAVWVFDADGRTLVASNVYPVPENSYRDRDYFAAHLGGDVGVFIGEIIQPRVQTEPPTPPFFAVSRRRAAPDGTFTGVVQVSVVPNELERFLDRPLSGRLLRDGALRRDVPRAPSRDAEPAPARAGHRISRSSSRATRAAASISRARSSTGATA